MTEDTNNWQNVEFLNNPARFLDPYKFRVTFECIAGIPDGARLSFLVPISHTSHPTTPPNASQTSNGASSTSPPPATKSSTKSSTTV